MDGGDSERRASGGVTVDEVRGPIGDGGALLTLVLSNGLEADVRVEAIRTADVDGSATEE